MRKEKKIDSTNNYRPSGQLESLGVEKLPPTPITKAAESVLKKMGLSDLQISEIRDFCSAFRYDRCIEKVERLAQTKIYLENSHVGETLTIPYYYDTNGRVDGQCGDIGRQLIVMAEFTGLIDDLNSEAKLKRGHEIVISFCNGLSKTHFCQEGMRHVWNRLIELDETGHQVRSVLIDAAFQKIMTLPESGYQEYGSSLTNDLEMKHSAQLPVGSIRISGSVFSGSGAKSVVLGISNDGTYSYALAFARREHHDKDKRIIIPILGRGLKNGNGEWFLFNPDSGELLGTTVALENLSQKEEDEIRGMLGACIEFEYTEDLSTYPKFVDNLHTVKWQIESQKRK